MALFASALLALLAPVIERDSFGVPNILAESEVDGFRSMGFAVAQDRLWQMELSRRMAQGRLAEVMGSSYAAADRETLKIGYTDAELDAQFAALPSHLRTLYQAYADGVNQRMASALPPGYAANGFSPEPWTVRDSVAISINLLQRFGRGGAGELRNLLLLKYAETKPKLKDRKFDFFDDFVFTESGGLATLPRSDDKGQRVPFPKWSRADTMKQYAGLPPMGLLELAGSLKLASREASTLVAEQISAPFHTGSYAVVVSPKKSATGRPLLLSGPQMGFRNPSIVHQIRMASPTLSTEGMDVPGIPGIMVGTTPFFAWGLTTGVADTEDMVIIRDTSKLVVSTRTLRVKGKPDETVERVFSGADPVVLRKGSFAVAQRSAFRGLEYKSTIALDKLWRAGSAAEIDAAFATASLNFNGFYATRDDHIGWRYCGLYPIRENGLDPRLPIEESQAWKSVATSEQMPHVLDPASGVIFNWNNRPTEWWPNSDTPAWGQIFRNSELKTALGQAPYNIQRLERAAWQIARTDETWPYFSRFTNNQTQLAGFDGWMLSGSIPANYYQSWKDSLRSILFRDITGNFLSESNFSLVAQPSVMLKALTGKTKLDYRTGRDIPKLVTADQDMSTFGGYVPGKIASPDGIPIPYSNRGSYIQLIEFAPEEIQGQNVAPPGISESGDHDRDQANLARTWTYRPMVGWFLRPLKVK